MFHYRSTNSSQNYAKIIISSSVKYYKMVLSHTKLKRARNCITKLERSTLWSTQTFQKSSSCHITGDVVATNGRRNATTASKVIFANMFFKVIAATLCSDSMVKAWHVFIHTGGRTDGHGRAHNMFLFKAKT